MAVRTLPLTITQQTASSRYGIVRSPQAELHCPICGEAVDINTSKDDAVTKSMHEACYVLRQMLKQATIPTDRPRA